MIRPANQNDLEDWYRSALEFHARTVYNGIEPSQVAIVSTFGQCLHSALGFIWVEEHAGRIEGCLLGIAQPLWWSGKRYATDLAFWFMNPWDGVKLARRFVRWAEEIGASEVTMGVSSGIGSMDPVFRRIGLMRVGGLYTRVI